jgi:phosphoglycolate phosphatase
VRLLLFDIDGTLLIARGAGRRALALALRDVYGTPGNIDGYDLRGQTDPRIVFDLMEGAGLAREAVEARLDECFHVYAQALAAEIGDGSAVVTLPGIGDLVRRLHGDSRVVLGLLTGNIEAGARIKLGPTGLLPYFRLGAYGSDHHDRRELPSLAARRAHALAGTAFAPDQVVVIGDTPRDIECARHFGAVAVAVATGQYPRQALEAAQPDVLFDDFADVDGALGRLLPD